ncbi:MAG: SRPBCC family protein [Candidatus Limnocylindria bacterium]
MIEPIRLSFEVSCPPDHAFATWTSRATTWWPASHTVTAAGGVEVVFEGRTGGRIFERTPAGDEHDWGEILAWEPPSRIAYLWHLKADRADATEVEIRFLEAGAAGTRVEIEHRGWERIGLDGQSRRDANEGGWGSLLPHYIERANRSGLKEHAT